MDYNEFLLLIIKISNMATIKVMDREVRAYRNLTLFERVRFHFLPPKKFPNIAIYELISVTIKGKNYPFLKYSLHKKDILVEGVAPNIQTIEDALMWRSGSIY